MSNHKYILNPFAFPQETNLRFLLLIVVVFVLSISTRLPGLLAFRVLSNPLQSIEAFEDAVTEIQELGRVEIPVDEENPSSFLSHFVLILIEVIKDISITFMFALISLTIAAGIFLLHPVRIQRKQKLKVIPLDKQKYLRTNINELANIAGIKMPILYINNSDRANGQTYGLPGRPIMALQGGIRKLLVEFPAGFKAMILHELAHIYNQDIFRTYFSRSLLLPIILLSMAPIIITPMLLVIFQLIYFGGTEISPLYIVINIILLFQAISTFVIAIYILSSLLRSREIYADWRVKVWGWGNELIKHMQFLLSQGVKDKKRRLIKFHPTLEERLDRLKNPESLFRVSKELPLLVGVLLAFLTPSLISIIDELSFLFSSLVGVISSFLIYLGSLETENVIQIVIQFGVLQIGILFTFMTQGILIIGQVLPTFLMSLLVIGSVGMQVQREAILKISTNKGGFEEYIRLFGPAALVAIGYEIGALFGFMNQYSPFTILLAGELNSLFVFVLIIPWLGLLTISTWLSFVIIRFLSVRLLTKHIGHKPPQKLQRRIFFVTSVMLWINYFPVFVVRRGLLYQNIQSREIVEMVLSLSLNCFLLPLIFLLLIPVSKWFRDRKVQNCPNCAEKIKWLGDTFQNCKGCGMPLNTWVWFSG